MILAIAEVAFREYAWILLWWLSCGLPGVAAMLLLRRYIDGRVAMKPGSAVSLESALFFSFTTGVIIQIAVLIALAAIQQLYPHSVIATLVVLQAASAWVIARATDEERQAGGLQWPGAGQCLAVLPVFLLVGAWALKPLGPAMEHDELSYHLPYARFYLEQAGLAVNEYLRYPLHTHNFNMLYTLALMRDSLSMAHLMHASAGFATLLMVHGVARRQYGSATAFVAVLLCLGFGELTRSFGNAYADLGLMLFVVASALALLEWERERSGSWLALAAVFAGAAIGTKYFGLMFAAMLALWVLWSTHSLRKFMAFCALSGSVGAFWYLRSWFISGNPVHPFMGEVFGYFIWSEEQLLNQMWELQSHGVVRNFFNFLLLPKHFYTSGEAFHGSIRMDWLLLGLFYLAVLLSWLIPRSWRPMVVLSVVFLVFWFCSAQILRYLLPVVPLMALAASAALSETVGLFYPPRSTTTSKRRWIAQGWLLPVIIVVSVFYGTRQGRVDLFHVPILAETQHRFLLENNSGYELLLTAAADPRIGQGPLLQLNHAGSIFFFPGLLYGDWNGPYSWRDYLELNREGELRLIPPQRMLAKLRDQGIRGVVFSYDPDRRFFPLDRFGYDQYFDLVFENRFGIVMVPKTNLLEKKDPQ